MSLNEKSSSKCLSTNESNIPISRRFHVDSAKKSKKRNDIPELQRYVETIVKAQIDYDREIRENSKSYRKARKALNVLEKNETALEHENTESDKQNELKPSGYIKARKHEYAERGIKICEGKFKRMDYSYQIDMNPILEIEKFLRKLYPNPYDLDKVSEFQVLKASQNFRDTETRSKSLKAPSILDGIPSNADSSHSDETLVSQMSTENDGFLKADIFIDQDVLVQNFDDILSGSPDNYVISNTSESITCSKVIKAQNYKDNIEDTKMSTALKNKIESRISSSLDRIISRPSSVESEIRHFNPDIPVEISKKRNFSRRTNVERSFKALPSKNKSDALVVLGKQNFSNLGSLVNSYDSNETIQGDTIDERSRYEEDMTEETKKKENIKNASKKYCKNPTELYQLYHVMDKTAESILNITSRNEKDKDQCQEDTSQDTKMNNHIKSLELPQRSSILGTKDLEVVNSSDRLHPRARRRFEREHSSPRQIERSLKNKSNLIAAFQKERSKYDKERNVAEEEGDDYKGKPETRKDDDDCDELSGTNREIDDVLQYMCDCLRKFTINHNDQTCNDVVALESVEVKKPKSDRADDSKDTNHISHEERNSTNLASKDTITPPASKYNNFEEDFYPLEIVRNKSLTPRLSLEAKDISNKLSPGKHRRRKRPQIPQSLTKGNFSDEKTLEMSPISLTISSERLVMSSTPSRRPEIPDITPDSESIQQNVEPQNELGGYNEEQPREVEIGRESQPKTLYPARFRKQKGESYRILKNALDTEEKLLADNLVTEEKSSTSIGNSFKPSKSSFLAKDGSPPSKLCPYTLMEEIKQQRSSFVICVSSVPRHLRTGYPTISKIPYATSLSIAMSNLRKSWDVKKVRKEPKIKKLKKLDLEPWIEHVGHEYRYRFETNFLLTMGRKRINQTAVVVGLVVVYAVSMCEDEVLSKNSECLVKIKSGLPKKSLFVENINVPVPPLAGTFRNPAQISSSMMLSLQEERIDEEENFEIGEAASERTLEELEESEENILLLEPNDESEQMLTGSGTSVTYVIQKESSHSQPELTDTERERKKIEDLLLRTYNLQHKLHRYLHRISPQTSSHYPLIERDPSIDLDVTHKSDESGILALLSSPTDIQPPSPSTHNKDSQVYWLFEPKATKETQTKECDSLSEVEKIDHATSYHPPSDDSCRSLSDTKPDSLMEDSSKTEETSPKSENDEDDDDRSSTYSFKSSNDFSESNKMANVEEKPKVQKTTNRNSQFLKKIFHELELFRKTITETKDQMAEDKPETKDWKNHSVALDKPKSSHMTHSTGDSKPSGKALKTVFKGKESTTELTIGLKDVPISDGSNISVEKKKFSQNHTKISISISKEKPEEWCELPKRCLKFASDNIRTTLSSYYFDSLRPSLSDCEAKFSRLEDDTYKSVHDYDAKEEGEEKKEEEEDDDYKSVASSIVSKSDTDIQEETDEKPVTKASKTLPAKTFTKHRFDFYRKMTLDTDYDMARTKKIVSDSVSKYKELEPLKEALTEMQMRMRKLKRNSYFSSSEYYQRALKLAKMSAGFCHSCGSQSIIPENGSFSYNKTLHSRRYPNQCKRNYLSSGVTPNPNSSFYSFRSSSGDLRTRFCDLDVCHSPYIIKGPTYSAGRILDDVPIFLSKI